jgi:outer membrane receptor for ferrienterochelin and colicins
LTYAGSLAQVAIDAGLELRREHITADRVPGGRRSLDVAEPYVQLTVPVGAVSLVAGSRVSWSEQWGRSFTPRVAALWRPVAPLGIRASLARGFRAPDFKELYLEFVNQAAGYAVVGNPDLDPEHSTSAAVSAEWAGTRMYSRVEGFRHRYRNFIEALAADENGTFTYGNVGSGTVTGTELHLATNAGIFRAEAGYAYLHTRDEATGYSLLGRPEHSGRLTLGVAAARWPRLNVSAVYTGETPIARDEEGRTSATQPAYTRLDVRLAHDIPGALTLVLGADNVLDRELGDDWPGYTGRRLYAGATWRPLELRSRRNAP